MMSATNKATAGGETHGDKSAVIEEYSQHSQRVLYRQ